MTKKLMKKTQMEEKILYNMEKGLDSWEEYKIVAKV